MKAVALDTDTLKLGCIDVEEPQIKADDEVKLKVLEVGICGTDRDEANGGRVDAPIGTHDLIIGHEMFGQVVEVGKDVKSVKPGDYALFSVRRGCNECSACEMHRPDMCYTGRYKERGIKQLNGYQAEFVVDKKEFLIPVPKEIKDIAVLTEPTSVVEKAIDEATRIQQARLPGDSMSWIKGKRVLVAGLGPIGLLAAMVLRNREAEVIGLDIVDESTARPQLLKSMGGQYVDGRKVKTDTIGQHCGQIDIIVEATGLASLDFDLLEALGINGVFVLTGIPTGHRPIQIDGSDLMQKLVLRNQVMVGSVNASPAHFKMAVADLLEGWKKFPGVLEKLITSRVPYADIDKVLSKHPADEIKTVIEWNHQ